MACQLKRVLVTVVDYQVKNYVAFHGSKIMLYPINQSVLGTKLLQVMFTILLSLYIDGLMQQLSWMSFIKGVHCSMKCGMPWFLSLAVI